MIKLKDLLTEARGHPSIYKALKKPASDLSKGEDKLSEAYKLLSAAWTAMPKELEEVRRELRKTLDALSKAGSQIDIIAGEVNSELQGTPMKPEFRKIHGIGGHHWKNQ